MTATKVENYLQWLTWFKARHPQKPKVKTEIK
jgi:hypothetical protein